MKKLLIIVPLLLVLGGGIIYGMNSKPATPPYKNEIEVPTDKPAEPKPQEKPEVKAYDAEGNSRPATVEITTRPAPAPETAEPAELTHQQQVEQSFREDQQRRRITCDHPSEGVINCQ